MTRCGWPYPCSSLRDIPVFQVIYGNHDIDLDCDVLALPSTRSEHAMNVAKDPVVAAEFFEFMCICMFSDLFGWDFNKGKSKDQGSILGKLQAHYGVAKLTERGQCHGHYLIWLTGACNPSHIHSLLNVSQDYCERFFSFFEGIIYHHLPDVDIDIDPKYEPRIELPPHASLISQAVASDIGTVLVELRKFTLNTSAKMVWALDDLRTLKDILGLLGHPRELYGEVYLCNDEHRTQVGVCLGISSLPLD